jgi:hypothetical protein
MSRLLNDQSELRREITEIEKDIFIQNLILDFMDDELKLVKRENTSSSLPMNYITRSVFNQENITDINGFQRLNLLLARHI